MSANNNVDKLFSELEEEEVEKWVFDTFRIYEEGKVPKGDILSGDDLDDKALIRSIDSIRGIWIVKQHNKLVDIIRKQNQIIEELKGRLNKYEIRKI